MELDGADGVVDDRLDLASVPDDAGVGEEAIDIALVVLRDRVEVETVEARSEVLALGEDRAPAQTGLGFTVNRWL